MKSCLLLVWCCVVGCQGGERGPIANPDAQGSAREVCTITRDCDGGEFCDRGMCAAVATHDQFGHGYGAQCVAEEFYPLDHGGSGRDLHCRGYECVAGHCSSCASDSECEEGYLCAAAPIRPDYPERDPDYPGKRCTLREAVENPPPPCDTPSNPTPCRPRGAELFASSLVDNDATECQDAKGCRGDEFCDRGRCVGITVDPFGHGYGAILVRREPPSVEDTCLGFLSIDRWCSSCLADSECFAGAPYCIQNPIRPQGKSCAPYPQNEYYGADGKVAPSFSDMSADDLAAWLNDYRAFLESNELYQTARAEVGLPVAPSPPPLADDLN